MRERDVHEEQTRNVYVLRTRNKSGLVRWSLLLLAATVLSLVHLPLRLSDRNLLVTKEANSLIWMIDMFQRQQKLRKVCHPEHLFLRCLLGMLPFQLRLEMNSLTCMVLLFISLKHTCWAKGWSTFTWSSFRQTFCLLFQWVVCFRLYLLGLLLSWGSCRLQLVTKSSVLQVTVFGLPHITIVRYKHSVVSCHALFEE